MKTIVANLKMSFTKNEAINYFEKLNKQKKLENVELIICPSYTYIYMCNETNCYMIGSQDVSEHKKYNHTGEISVKQLKSMNVKYTIVGHSENKTATTKQIIKKIINLQENDMIPIICISKVSNKINNILLHVNNKKPIVVAYEPEKSIGTGNIEKKDKIIKQCTKLKNKLENMNYTKYKILYGGSVNKNNCNIILKNNIIDGFVVGEQSIDITNLFELINKIEVIE